MKLAECLGDPGGDLEVLGLGPKRLAAEPDHGVPVGSFTIGFCKQPPALIERVISQDDVNIRATVLTNRLVFVGVGKIASGSICAVEGAQQRFNVNRAPSSCDWVTGRHGRLKRVVHSRSRQPAGPPRRRNEVREARRLSGTRHPPNMSLSRCHGRVRNLLLASRSFGPGGSDRQVGRPNPGKGMAGRFRPELLVSELSWPEPRSNHAGNGGVERPGIGCLPRGASNKLHGQKPRERTRGRRRCHGNQRREPGRAGRAGNRPASDCSSRSKASANSPARSRPQASRIVATVEGGSMKNLGGLPADRNSSRSTWALKSSWQRIRSRAGESPDNSVSVSNCSVARSH